MKGSYCLEASLAVVTFELAPYNANLQGPDTVGFNRSCLKLPELLV